MVAMELAEVISPQVAFPVFGVVLCAVLVFAFGFKSPVQPPSFAFEDEKKSNKKQKKSAKKLQNGHIGGNELTNGSPTTSSPKPAVVKQSPSNKQSAEKHEGPKPKKKTPVTPKNTAKAQKVAKQEPAKEQDIGEWTTALSRKEKKMRGKKDDRVEKFVEDGWADEPQSDGASPGSVKSTDPVADTTPEVGPGGDNAEAKKPMEQRNTKKDRKKKSGTGESKSNEPATVGKPVVTATSVAASAAATDNKDDKQEDEATTSEPTAPLTKQKKEEAEETTRVDGSPQKSSPSKKKKKKSSRLPEQVSETLTNVTETSMHVEPSDVVAETTVPDAAAAIAEAMQESHDVESQETESVSTTQQDEAVTATSTESKPRSPKKKRKTKDKEKEKIQTPSPSDPQSEASHTEDLAESSAPTVDSRTAASTTPLSQSQPQTSEGAATDRLDASSIEETSSAAQAEAASSKPKPSTSSEEQSKVNFDELGDWQEAKKKEKKKKKPRREN